MDIFEFTKDKTQDKHKDKLDDSKHFHRYRVNIVIANYCAHDSGVVRI